MTIKAPKVDTAEKYSNIIFCGYIFDRAVNIGDIITTQFGVIPNVYSEENFKKKLRLMTTLGGNSTTKCGSFQEDIFIAETDKDETKQKNEKSHI